MEKLNLILKQIPTLVKFVLLYYLSSGGCLGTGKMAWWPRPLAEDPSKVLSNHDI